MGADLFESFVGAIVASCVLGSGEYGTPGIQLPLYIVALGLFICILGTWHIKCKEDSDLSELLKSMRFNVIVSGIFITIGVFVLTYFIISVKTQTESIVMKSHVDLTAQCQPFNINVTVEDYTLYVNNIIKFNNNKGFMSGFRLFAACVIGLVIGILIGMITEYFTSFNDPPTQSIAKAAHFGHGPVIIEGLGQGMYSCVAPLILVVIAVLSAYKLAGFYGTAISCVGMLSTLGVTMATDA